MGRLGHVVVELHVHRRCGVGGEHDGSFRRDRPAGEEAHPVAGPESAIDENMVELVFGAPLVEQRAALVHLGVREMRIFLFDDCPLRRRQALGQRLFRIDGHLGLPPPRLLPVNSKSVGWAQTSDHGAPEIGCGAPNLISKP